MAGKIADMTHENAVTQHVNNQLKQVAEFHKFSDVEVFFIWLSKIMEAKKALDEADKIKEKIQSK